MGENIEPIKTGPSGNELVNYNIEQWKTPFLM